MPPALLSVSRAIALGAALVGAHTLAAGGPAAGGSRPASFSLLVTATPPKGPSPTPSNGVGVGPAKPVVTNPYNVPLLQNAGSLRSTR